jgi:hypothetical protein
VTVEAYFDNARRNETSATIFVALTSTFLGSHPRSAHVPSYGR